MKIKISESQYRLLTENNGLNDIDVKYLNYLYHVFRGKPIEHHYQITDINGMKGDLATDLWFKYNSNLDYAKNNGGKFNNIKPNDTYIGSEIFRLNLLYMVLSKGNKMRVAWRNSEFDEISDHLLDILDNKWNMKLLLGNHYDDFMDNLTVDFLVKFYSGLNYAELNDGKFNGIDKFSMPSDLWLEYSSVETLPDNFSVGGSLFLEYSKIKYLPNNLNVSKSLIIDGTEILSLPKDIKIGGDLSLKNTVVEYLPDNLIVGGDVVASGGLIHNIGNGVEVFGDMWLEDNPIELLGNGISVGNNLYMDNTNIKSIPNELLVGGNLYLRDTPISKRFDKDYVEELIVGMGGGVMGHIIV